ncbi:high mobility group nucleosome-binding domain-containing protein 5-like [Branchiostoma floridae]|uniref:High mobility group nucleosome-binding domain-containing protein 5-like n=1 Tax=Branchiostoma floridae TaxID=7739 RepID=A0A9J7N0P2_BRAFL|nr:high mobility group nucleosome-binding domain-containing protein 5-like [Branchiostoma floridae]
MEKESGEQREPRQEGQSSMEKESREQREPRQEGQSSMEKESREQREPRQEGQSSMEKESGEQREPRQEGQSSMEKESREQREPRQEGQSSMEKESGEQREPRQEGQSSMEKESGEQREPRQEGQSSMEKESREQREPRQEGQSSMEKESGKEKKFRRGEQRSTHIRALNFCRIELVESIHYLLEPILDQMIQDDVIADEVCRNIRSMKSPHEQGRKLLEYLSTGSRRAYVSFKRGLQRVKLPHIVDMLEEAEKLPAQSPIDQPAVKREPITTVSQASELTDPDTSEIPLQRQGREFGNFDPQSQPWRKP